MIEAIRQFLRSGAMTGERIVVAVSGGVDSTALLLALHELGEDLVAAHVNHHLRGEESNGDERFVRELCTRLDVPLKLADGALDAEAVRRRGIEAAAREVRHARLHEIRTAAGARWIATAHQKDDQAETVLMRLLTGSGPAGLRGIHPVRDDGVIRPLLEITRAEIETFLQRRGIVPRIDRTNADPRFLRNRLRVLVRELHATAPLAAAAEQARQEWRLIEPLLDQADRDCATATIDDTRFLRWPDNPWLRQSLLHRHIWRLDPDARDVSRRDLVRIAARLDSLTRISITKSLELLRRDGIWILQRRPSTSTPPAFELSVEYGGAALAIPVPELGATLHFAPAAGRGDALRFQFPVEVNDRVPARFIVRNRRAGDRFQPLGLGFDKKLKDFLIDRKIAAGLRDRIPLILWQDRVVLVTGVEVSETFKVVEPTVIIHEVWLERSESLDRDHRNVLR